MNISSNYFTNAESKGVIEKHWIKNKQQFAVKWIWTAIVLSTNGQVGPRVSEKSILLKTILQIFKWELWNKLIIIKYENLRYTSEAITKTNSTKLKHVADFKPNQNL